jgi:hypothetical protein
MKPADKAFLDGLRKSVCVDIEQGHWDLVVKAVDDAGDIRDVTGYARTIILEGVEKAKFSSRSEAGRYAANMRWKGQGDAARGGKQADEKINQRRSDDSAKREAKETADRVLLEADAERAKSMLGRGGLTAYETLWAKDKIAAHSEAKMKEQLAYEAKRDQALGAKAGDIADAVSERDEPARGQSSGANSEEAQTKQAFVDSQKERLANMGRGTSQVAYMALESGIKKLEAELASGDTSEARNRPGQFFDDRPGAKGEKYIGRRPVKEVAVDIRRDIKDAVSSGELPTGLKFSVKSDTRGTNAVRVRVSGTGRTRDESGRLTGEAKAVYEKVSSIVNAYNRDNSDMMTDYFDTDYYGTVQLDD